MSRKDPGRKGELLEKTSEETDEPKLYRVVLHNDDYTSMEFVVEILETVFSLSPAEAYRVMMLVHQRGAGTAGVYPHEVAETKVSLVHSRAREEGYPLRASLEEA